MTYFDQLYPWCIIRPLPNMQRLIVARFRRRNDAEAHLRLLRQLIPNVTYIIVFDIPLERQHSTLKEEAKVPEIQGE